MKASIIPLVLLQLLVIYVASTTAQSSAPFEYGVLAAEMTSNSALLWTRCAEETTQLQLMLSSSSNFTSIDQKINNIEVTSDNDFTVQVTVDGLDANTWYYYKFALEGSESEVGRFRTAPDASTPTSLRIAFSGDVDGAKMPNGTPYWNDFEMFERIIEDEADFFAFVGDTIYADSTPIKDNTGFAAETLTEFRNIYKLNRSYKNQRDMFHNTGTYVLWDDHEVYNNWSNEEVNKETFENAKRAFYEYNPIANYTADLRSKECYTDPLFRYFKWGSDVDVIVVDTRSCRSGSFDLKECNPLDIIKDPLDAGDKCLDELNLADRTILGEKQKDELKRVLKNSTAKFKLVLNNVPIIKLTNGFDFDKWEGYPRERREILKYIEDERISGVVFLTTDIHQNIISDVYTDRLDRNPVAKEIVTGPIAERQSGSDANVPPRDPFCFNPYEYGYGLLEYDHVNQTLSITLKNEKGEVIRDRRDNSTECRIVIQSEETFERLNSMASSITFSAFALIALLSALFFI